MLRLNRTLTANTPHKYNFDESSRVFRIYINKFRLQPEMCCENTRTAQFQCCVFHALDFIDT